MKKALMVSLCALFLVFSATVTAYSIPPEQAPYPWRIELENGLSFYMLPRGFSEMGSELYLERYGWRYGWVEGIEDFAQRQSGLYRGDELIYAIEGIYFWHRYDLILSDDGMSFLGLDFFPRFWFIPQVHLEPDWDGTNGRICVFYQGQRTHQFYWTYFNHNRGDNTLQIEAFDRETQVRSEIIFDLSTGSIISEYILPPEPPPELPPESEFPHGILIGGIILVISVIFLLVLIKHKRSK